MTTTLHDLIERWNKACDETYIRAGRDKFWLTHRAAEALAQWYEDQFRENRSYRNEERMRYWRMVAAKELDNTEGQSFNGVHCTHPAHNPVTAARGHLNNRNKHCHTQHNRYLYTCRHDGC